MDTALKAIAEPRRREILRLVWDRELPAGEIAGHFEISRPAISQHLRVLRDAELLSERRAGTQRLYRAQQNVVNDLLTELADYWSTSLTRLRDVAEQTQRAKRAEPNKET